MFKQKTAYGIRMSVWSSDVCAADLSAECDADGTPMKELPGILHDEGQHGIRPIIVDGMQRGGWGYHYQPGREVAAGSIDVHVHAIPGEDRKSTRLNSSH